MWLVKHVSCCRLQLAQSAGGGCNATEGSRGVKFMGMVNKRDPPAASQPHLC